jgi:hypothetical protein
MKFFFALLIIFLSNISFSASCPANIVSDCGIYNEDEANCNKSYYTAKGNHFVCHYYNNADDRKCYSNGVTCDTESSTTKRK